MPTGYTHPVADGEITTLREFAWRCARAFGAAAHQRDDTTDAPLRKPQPNRYYVDALNASRKELERIQALTLEQAAAEAEAEYVAPKASHIKSCANMERKRERYDAMLQQVVKWKPPTPAHVALRDFMLSQLHESVKFDIYPVGEFEGPSRDGEVWRALQVRSLLRSIESNAKSALKDQHSCEQAAAWIDALDASLPKVSA